MLFRELKGAYIDQSYMRMQGLTLPEYSKDIPIMKNATTLAEPSD
jgi:hypothetical protein